MPSRESLLRTLGGDGMHKKIKTKKEVKDLYRKSAFNYHPDRNPGQSGEKMKDINVAWAHAQKSDWFTKLSKYTVSWFKNS